MSSTGITKPEPLAPPPIYTQLTASQSDEVTSNIRTALRRLRLDDMASIAQQKQEDQGPFADEVTWFTQQLKSIKSYFSWMVRNWYDIGKLYFKGTVDPFDFVSVVLFSLATGVILACLWVWCAFSTFPVVIHLYDRVFGKATGGLSLSNGSNAHLFKNLTQGQCEAAKEKLSEELDSSAPNTRIFNLDVAKFLLQVSSLMYERNSSKDVAQSIHVIQENLEDKYDSGLNLADIETPGLLFKKLIGSERLDGVKRRLASLENNDRAPIDAWTQTYNMCFEPVSELATVSGAYCSIFWDPDSTWIIVAFRGTDLRSFEEWTTDFSAMFEDASADIPGFLNVHRGFKERIFPSQILEGKRKPWETISEAIKIVSQELTRYREPDLKCNVWFTGHSLGTAIASLAYAKALLSDDLGNKAILRDGYMFATPITTDITSRNAFNAGMYQDRTIPRTLWRITNRNDFVATGLPALGDRDGAVKLGRRKRRVYTLNDGNLFAYCHLGIEIFMKTRPKPSEVGGNRIKDWGNFDVQVSSKFSPQEVVAQRQLAERGGLTVWKVFSWLQDLPVVGALAAHAATNYYDQLDQIAISAAAERS